MICWGRVVPNSNIFTKKDEALKCYCLPKMCIDDVPESTFLNKDDLNNTKRIRANLEMNRDQFMKDLSYFVRAKTISSKPEYWGESKELLDRTASMLKGLDFTIEQVKVQPKAVNEQEINEDITKPEVILATNYSSRHKNTLLIYAYLDVREPYIIAEEYGNNDEQRIDPFILTENEGRIYGSGVTTSKAALLSWLYALTAWKEEEGDLPLNIKIIVEAMREQNSMGLEEVFKSQMQFFDNVDFFVMYTNTWLSPTHPMLTTSTAGHIYFGLEVRVPKKPRDIKEGDIPRPPMTDLTLLLNSLVNAKNEMRIPNIERFVYEVTQTDWMIMEALELSREDYKRTFKVHGLPHGAHKQDMFTHSWTKSSLSMHGVRGAFHGSGSSQQLSDNVVGYFSIKIMAEQDLKNVELLVRDYLQSEYQRLRSVNDVRLLVLKRSAPTYYGRNAIHINAAKQALEQAHSVKPHVSRHISLLDPTYNLIQEYAKGAKGVQLPFGEYRPWLFNGKESIPTEMLERNLDLSAGFIYKFGLMRVKCKCEIIEKFCKLELVNQNRRGFLDMLDEAVYENPSVIFEIDNSHEFQEIEENPDRNDDKSRKSRHATFK